MSTDINSGTSPGTPGGGPSAPGAPGAFAISSAAAQDGEVTLTWGASAGAQSYRIERGTASGVYPTVVSPHGSSPFLDTGLTDGTTYYYMVVAVNTNGFTDASAEVTATPTAGPGPFTLSSVAGDSQATISWTASKTAASYTLKRGTTSGQYPNTLSTAATSPYTDTGLTVGTRYYYMVTATNAFGNTNASAETSVVPVAPPTLTGVFPPSGSTLGGTTLTLTGTQFIAGTTVTVGGNAATRVVIVSATTIICVTPTGTAGAADVVVTSPGSPSAPFANGFEYVTSNTWATITAPSPPTAVGSPASVWTGAKLIVFGGANGSGGTNDGAIYDPVANTWSPTSTGTNVPPAADSTAPLAVWTGAKMVVWNQAAADGGVYDPSTDTWAAISPTGAPAARQSATAVWAGSKMVVWGGASGATALNTGAMYDPVANTWTAVSATGAPAARENHAAVSTGTLMVVWGGYDGSATYFNSGGRFNPANNSWTTTNPAGTSLPDGRQLPAAVWTGSRVVFWGGLNGSGLDPSGALYDPAGDAWSAISTANAPPGNVLGLALYTGSKVILWGGESALSSGSAQGVGAVYDPVGNTWTTMATTGAPAARFGVAVAGTGGQVLVWGGMDTTPAYYGNGFVFTP